MNELYFIHALDKTTSFLSVFREHFEKNFYTIEPNKGSVENSIKYMQEIPENSVVVFLGHGHSTGLYTPESEKFSKEIFINSEIGNQIFSTKRVLLLSCNSNQYIRRLDSFKYIIGFGNILSSMNEVSTEAEIETGVYRDLSENDIHFFNSAYSYAIINALKKYNTGTYRFNELPTLIEFYINQKINEILLNKKVENRVEIARLLFEFRNEMILLKN